MNDAMYLGLMVGLFCLALVALGLLAAAWENAEQRDARRRNR